MIQIVVGPLTHHDATEAHRVEIRILVLGGGGGEKKKKKKEDVTPVRLESFYQQNVA